MERTITIIWLSLCFLISKASSWTGSGIYDTSWYNDLSTSFDIRTANELAGLAYLCNNGNSFAGKTINLQSDIDLWGYDWDPISIFEGTFNGNHYKIENLKIDYYDSGFGITKGFIIKNTGYIECVELQGSVLLASRGYGEISAGGLCVENEGRIKNCIIDCIVNAYNKSSGANNGYNHNAGGVCAFNKGYIINCVNKGNISAKPSVYDYRARINCAAGVAGYNEGEIINCFNFGDIYTVVGFDSSTWKGSWGLPYGYSGGICGYSAGTINNSVSIANIQAEVVRLGKTDGTNAYAGGIVANSSGTVTNAYYSSSKTLEAPHIINEGLKLGDTQLNNTSYSFTDLLNQNVLDLSNANICFWANSKSKNSNIPFHLNGFAVTTQVDNISQNTATFNAIPTDISSSAIASKGFEYRKRGNLTYKKVYASNDFSVSVADLELSAVYDVRAFVITTDGTIIYFSEKEFSTSPISVETKEATDVTAISAVLKGYIQSGNTAIKSQGFLWKAENETSFHIVYTEGQDFEYKIENLTPNTLYNYQAFILTSNGENLYGETMNFSTHPIAITFNQNTFIDRNNINIKGNINVNISTDVTIEYKKITDSNYIKKVIRSNDDGSFECNLLGLLPNTNYDCRAYMIYNSAYTYSQVYTYKTLNVLVQTLAPLLDKTVTFCGEVIGGSNTGIVGFEYRNANYPDLIASEYIYSSLKNTFFTVQTNNVVNGNEYKYRAFYQEDNGSRTFGEWIYFIPINVVTSINDIKRSIVKIVGYYNIQGKQMDKWQKGINIVRYSDGTTRKVIVK